MQAISTRLHFRPFFRLAAVAATALAVVLAAGCQSASKKPTPNEQATRRWNGARAAVLASLARDQYQAGNFDKCRQTVDEALRLSPDNAALRVVSAKLLIERGELEAADRELKLARTHAPNDGEAYYLAGVIAQRWQKAQEAYELYQTAASKSPAELAYVLAEAEALVALDRTPDALALLQGKLAYFEHSGTIRDAVGQLLVQLGRSDEALALFRQAAILSDDDDGIRERLAMALYAHKDYGPACDAIERLTQAPANAKRADLLVALGQCQLELGRARAARGAFESAAQADPESALAWRGLGRATLETGDPRRAEMSLARSLKLDDARAESHLLMGYARLQQERFADALASFDRASRLDPADPAALCMSGYVHEKLGRRNEAGGFYKRALELQPGDAFAAQLLAGVDLND